MVDTKAMRRHQGETREAGAEPLSKSELQNQDRHWSRHAARYEELFVDPYDPAVDSPFRTAVDAITDASAKTVADLGCGTGPLLPLLAQRFGRVIALDFAAGMLERAKERLEPDAVARVTFLNRPMHQLDDLAGQLDVAIAVNSVVMPDTRLIDRTLQSIRASLKPGGQFMGVVPSIDTIYNHMMLVMDQSLDQGVDVKEAKRIAGLHAERRYYDFAFGEFHYDGLRQKFWQPFELEYRLNKAGFTSIGLAKVLYPWDESAPASQTLVGLPRSWDWFFTANA